MNDGDTQAAMEEESDLLLYIGILKRNFKAMFLLVLLGVFVAGGYFFYATKLYKASAVILPLGKGSGGGAGALLSEVASMASGSLGVGGGGGDKSSINISVLLDSRSLAERVVGKLQLDRYYFKDKWDSTLNQWKAGLVDIPTIHDAAQILLENISVEKNIKNGGVLTISVAEKDPKLAVEIIKTILSELQQYLEENTLTESKRQRIFVEKQMTNNTKELLEAGKEITNFYQKNNISKVYSLIDVDLYLRDVAADLDENTSVKNLDDKVKALQDEKERLEKRKYLAQVQNVPQQVYLEYLTQKKQVLTSLTMLFSQQYVMAKMDEAKENVSFLIIDQPIQAKNPFKPKAKYVLMAGFILGALAAVFYAFTFENIKKVRR